MRAEITIRVRFIIFAFALVCLLLISRLYFIQVVDGNEYAERANRQYKRPNQSLYDRGSIFFTNKDVGAATLKTGYTIAISPKNIEDAEGVYNSISKIVEIDRDSFFLKAGKAEDPYEEIATRVPEKDALEIDSLELPGVGIYKDRWRFYPGGNSASHVLGFVGFKGDELTGRYGLEQYYDDILKRDSENSGINFFAEIFSNIKKVVRSDDLVKEGDLITSIETKVQAFLEETLSSTHSKYESNLTGGIIINPITGEIYALAVSPNFDPNKYNEEKSVSVFTNPIVEDVYEMGSIIKPLTMASGLDSGAITAETVYDDQGSITLDGKTISNFDGRGRGVVNMQEVLNQSLNTGVSFVVQQMGNDNFRKYMYKFGFKEKTGIDLPNEASPLVSNLESPRNLEYATASFGQGVAMTPIATVRALSALANGGTLISPHIVKEIDYKVGIKEEIKKEVGKRAISEETSDEITRMLVEVVDEALAGGTVALTNHSVAAKTGTAQIANPGGGGYYEDRFLHSFFGYFPAYNPRFLVFLYTVYPKGVRYASETLTDPFMDITRFLISYYEIPPDR